MARRACATLIATWLATAAPQSTTAQWVPGGSPDASVEGADTPPSGFLAEPVEPTAEDLARFEELLDRRDALQATAPAGDVVVEMPALPGDETQPPGIDSPDPNPDRALIDDAGTEQ